MDEQKFTGERYVPGQGGARIAYEHLHRYMFALRWTKGKRVLDVAAGTGYGAAMMAEVADRVLAVELDGPSIEGARRSYTSENLYFARSDARFLPVRTSSVEVIVAFEILEHIEDQQSLVRELARVLRKDGAALISTPNKATYSDARRYRNPHHVRELYREELLALLEGHFASVRLMVQQVRAGSLMVLEDGEKESDSIVCRPSPLANRNSVPPLYFVALCGHQPSLDIPLTSSAYLDLTDYLFEEFQTEIQALGEWGKRLEGDVQRRDREIEQRDRTIRLLQAEMRREIEQRDAEIARLQGELEDRTTWAGRLQQDVASRDEKLRRSMEDLDRVGAHLARIRHALLYRILCRLGVLPK